MGIIDDMRHMRPLKQRKRIEYYELRNIMKDMKQNNIVTIDLRSSKKTLLKKYNEIVEKHEVLRTQLKTAISNKPKNVKARAKRIQKKTQLSNANKKHFTVNIDVKELHIYKKNSDKKYIIDSSAPLEATFYLNNKSKLPESINAFLNNIYPYENSYENVFLHSFKYVIRTNYKKVKAIDVPMKHATPFKVSFLKYFDKIDEMSYEKSNGECVIKTLLTYFQIRRRNTIIKSFESSSLRFYKKQFEIKNGVTGAMILEFCKEKNISCLGLDQRSNMFVKNVSDKNRGRVYKKSLFFYMVLGHMYIITDHNTIRSLSTTFSTNNSTFKSSLEIQDDNEITKKIFYEDLPLQDVLELGKNNTIIYNTTSLNELFTEYVKITNDVPKRFFKSVTAINKIITKNGATLACSSVITDNLDWKVIKNICEKNEIEFNNQGIGTLLTQLQTKIYSTKRISFTKSERESIKVEQNNKCNECHDAINTSFHIDHISSGGSNERINLQALCISCHIEKSKRENEACEYILEDKFISSFNLQALDIMKSNHFLKVAFTENLPAYHELNHENQSMFAIDMVKCRRNILQFYGANFAKYSVLDNIEIFDGILSTGFYYIETEHNFPLHSSGFYSLPMVEYVLENQMIEKCDIKYQFKPSFIIKHNAFQELVNYVLNAFSSHPKTAKLAINSLVGIYGRRNGSYIESIQCQRDNLDDIGYAYEQLKNPYCIKLSDDLVAVNSSKKIEKIELHFPIHAQIIDCEAIELHKITKSIEQHGGIPLQIKTDCVNYIANNEIVLNDKWCNGQLKYQSEQAKPLIKSVNIHNSQLLEIEPIKYNKIDESESFDNLAQDIINLNGCLIQGMAGCGKTYLTNKIINILENDNKKIVKLAPTNKACLNIGGQTLDKFAYGLLQGKKSVQKFNKIDYIIVDEISMVKEIFYQVLMYIKQYNPNIKFIIVGDFGQLEPVKDRSSKFNYENSRCLYELVSKNKLTLTICKRSDKTLFNECKRVRNNEPLQNQYIQNEETYLNVSFYNETRKEINHLCYERYLNENPNLKFTQINALHYDKNSQDYLLAKGMPVIARVNSKSLHIINNESFIVSKITNENITVINELNEEILIKKGKFNRIFHLAFCITVHKSQGATFDKKYTIYNWKKMNSKLKYVALSRGQNINNIQINRE